MATKPRDHPGVTYPEDRTPPQNIVAEQGVIGGMLRENGWIAEVRSIGLCREDFYRDSHQLIIDCIYDLDNKSIPVDVITITNHLRDRGVYDRIGGDEAIVAILDSAPHAANTKYYAEIVREKARSRAVIEAFNAGLRDAYSGLHTAGQLAARGVDALEASGSGRAGSAMRSLGLKGSAEFSRAVFAREFAVERFLVDRQPCIIGGPRKALKTSVSIDLAVSLASGLPFLGEFRVPRPRRVIFLSGESGEATTQETAHRICHTKGIRLADLDGCLFWGDRLPKLSRPDHLRALARDIRATGAEFVFIDPLYLCLASAGDDLNAANLFDMGPLLSTVSETCLEAGAAPIINHHFRKNRDDPKAPPELEDLAFAGVQEFARQWILIGRRSRYEPGTGQHQLWLVAGGSAGHSGSYALDVEEGTTDEDFGGRDWTVSIRRASDVREQVREQAAAEKAEVIEERQRVRDLAAERKATEDAERVAKHLREKGPATGVMIRTALGWRYDRLASAITRLEDGGRIEPTGVEVAAGKGKRTAEGYKLAERPGIIPVRTSTNQSAG